MNTFLILISFLLNGVMVMAVIILYTRQNRFLQMEKKQERIIRDMEDLISAYLQEMKEENESFIERFRDERMSGEAASYSLPEKEKTEEKKGSVPNNMIQPGHTYTRSAAAKAYLQSKAAREIDITEEDVNDPANAPELLTMEPVTPLSLKEQVLQLKGKGLSHEEIAKKLQKGKTEIELMLKFQEK